MQSTVGTVVSLLKIDTFQRGHPSRKDTFLVASKWMHMVLPLIKGQLIHCLAVGASLLERNYCTVVPLFKTTQWTMEISYISGDHKIWGSTAYKNALWDQIKWSYYQGGLKIKGCNIEFHCTCMCNWNWNATFCSKLCFLRIYCMLILDALSISFVWSTTYICVKHHLHVFSDCWWVKYIEHSIVLRADTLVTTAIYMVRVDNHVLHVLWNWFFFTLPQEKRASHF